MTPLDLTGIFQDPSMIPASPRPVGGAFSTVPWKKSGSSGGVADS